MKACKIVLFLTFLLTTSCTVSKSKLKYLADIEALQTENSALKDSLSTNKIIMKKQISTFLTFQDNNAENAMNFYIDIFENSKVVNIKRWGKEGPVEEGKIMHATFELDGNSFMCSDSPPIHDWNFSPAVSNFIECDNIEELERLFTSLSVSGNITMPLNNYGFNQKFGWVVDQYGISWQLNLQ